MVNPDVDLVGGQVLFESVDNGVVRMRVADEVGRYGKVTPMWICQNCSFGQLS